MIKDCVVVGGGMVGMMTAMELRQAGADVLLLDRHCLGGESSWAGGGIISPLYPWRYHDAINTLTAVSQALYPDLCQSLQAQTKVDPELLDSGLVVIDAEEQAVPWLSEHSITGDFVDNEALRQIEPSLASHYQRALFMPTVQQVRNPSLVKAIKLALAIAGVEVMENEEVRHFHFTDGCVDGVQTRSNRISAKSVVVASGAWSANLLSQLDVEFNIEPVKGQMIMLRATAGLLQRIIIHEGHYLIPRKDGRVLCGSTLEHEGFSKITTDDARNELFEVATRLVPDLAAASIERHWAGLRPGTTLGIPYICEHPKFSNLYINAGHYRNGITLGPASAKLMADIVLKRQPVVDPSPYRVNAMH